MDPQRRLLYDATGKDQHPPIEKEVQQILLSLFDRVLDEPDDVEIVATVRETAKAATRKFAEVRKEIKVRQEKLKAKRGKITSTSDVNLVHMIIDRDLAQMEAALMEMDHQEKVNKAVMAEIEKYSEQLDAPKPIDLGRISFGGTMRGYRVEINQVEINHE